MDRTADAERMKSWEGQRAVLGSGPLVARRRIVCSCHVHYWLVLFSVLRGDAVGSVFEMCRGHCGFGWGLLDGDGDGDGDGDDEGAPGTRSRVAGAAGFASSALAGERRSN